MEYNAIEHPGYDLLESQSVDENLLCVICGKPALSPLVNVETGRLVCSQTCVKVQSEKIFVEPQKLILNMLDVVQVTCKACKVQLKRGWNDCLFKKHVEDCPLTCPHGCKEVLSRKQLLEHNDVCVCRVIACPASDLGCLFVRSAGDTAVHKCEYLSLAPVLRAQEKEIKRLSSLVMSLESKLCYRYAQLSSVDFSGKDLSGHHFDGANLWKANFSNCNLSNAVFAGANLSFTNFSGANLSGASFARAQLHNVNLSETCLKDVVFASVDVGQLEACGKPVFHVILQNATRGKNVFQGADFSNRRFKDTEVPDGRGQNRGYKDGLFRLDLSGLDFSGFDLTGANFTFANLSRCNFSNADLSFVDFTRVQLDQAILKGAKMVNVKVIGSAFASADSRGIAAFSLFLPIVCPHCQSAQRPTPPQLTTYYLPIGGHSDNGSVSGFFASCAAHVINMDRSRYTCIFSAE